MEMQEIQFLVTRFIFVWDSYVSAIIKVRLSVILINEKLLECYIQVIRLLMFHLIESYAVHRLFMLTDCSWCLPTGNVRFRGICFNTIAFQ